MLRPVSVISSLLVCMLVQAAPADLPSEGVVQGIAAVGLWPKTSATPLSAAELASCEVHMIPQSNLDEEYVKPCSTWFLPPIKDHWYLLWMEVGSYVSGQEMTYHAGAAASEVGPGKPTIVPLHPAGWMTLNGIQLEDGQSIRLVSDDGFTRRVPKKRHVHKVLMPIGRTVVGVNNDHEGQYSYQRISAPLTVGHGQTTQPEFLELTKEAAVLIVRAQAPTSNLPESVHLAVEAGGTAVEPGFTSWTRSWTLGAWYGLEPGDVHTVVADDRLWAEPQTTRLRGGRVEFVLLQLHQLPSVDVHYELPEGLEGERSIQVEHLSTGKVVRAPISLDHTAGDITVAFLPTDRLRIRLAAGAWQFLETVDLSPGLNEHVVFQPRPIVISGRVTRGGDPAAAELGFQMDRNQRWEEVETDEQGQYEAVVFEEVELIRYRSKGGDQGQWILEPLHEPMTHDTTYDVELPDHDWRVHVVKADTEDPIEHAAVIYTNRHEGEGSQGAKLTTDANGEARLPPLRFSDLLLKVEAPEYRSATRELQLSAGGKEHTVEVELSPLDDELMFQVRLPTGQPARNAEVYLFHALDQGPMWRATCDDEGRVEAPDLGAPWFAARHADGGFAIRPIPADLESEIHVRLPGTGPPLVFQIVDPAGEGVASARFLVWQDGIPLGYQLRLFLMPQGWQAPDNQGVVTLVGLAPSPIDVVAYHPSQSHESRAYHGEFDHRRSHLALPWPQGLQVEVIQ